MGKIKEYHNYINTVVARVPAINTVKMIDDPTELNNHLKELAIADNFFLGVVLPNFGNNSPEDADYFKDVAFCELIIVQKTTSSNLSQEVWIDTFDDTHTAAKLVRDILLEDANEDNCDIVRQLNANSIVITSFNRSQLKGWSVVFTLDLDI
jgi:hypothetical protein